LLSIVHFSMAEWIPTTVARQLAAVAMLSGDAGVARSYYMQALEAAERIKFRPETVIIKFQFAELLVDEADYRGALSYLELCIPEFEQMRMRPWLERALLLRDRARLSAHTVITDGLTPREREVARLLAEGRSNRQIAERLVITEGTAEVHVKRILSKLGFHSRFQVAAWMAEHTTPTLSGPVAPSR
jgi:DNA-binding CsgD family transcriptional regulator